MSFEMIPLVPNLGPVQSSLSVATLSSHALAVSNVSSNLTCLASCRQSNKAAVSGLALWQLQIYLFVRQPSVQHRRQHVAIFHLQPASSVAIMPDH
jgi:hypothetical protein